MFKKGLSMCIISSFTHLLIIHMYRKCNHVYCIVCTHIIQLRYIYVGDTCIYIHTINLITLPMNVTTQRYKDRISVTFQK